MRRFNLHAAEIQYDADDPDGYHAGYARFGPELGAVKLGGTIYELPPGQSNCPYHYEYGNEEWLLVLEGTLTVRHPDGEDEVGPGEVVAFLDGPEGAHKLTNRSDAVVRVLMLSTKVDPSLSIYPDSDKFGAWSGPGPNSERIMVRRSSNVDYWDGETG